MFNFGVLLFFNALLMGLLWKSCQDIKECEGIKPNKKKQHITQRQRKFNWKYKKWLMLIYVNLEEAFITSDPSCCFYTPNWYKIKYVYFPTYTVFPLNWCSLLFGFVFKLGLGNMLVHEIRLIYDERTK